MFIFKTLKESSQELRKLNTLITSSLLLAICVVLGLLGTVMLGQFIRISFNYLHIALGSMLFGPVVGSILGALSDILNYILAPKGPFYPGFTINAIITGLIYGFGFYRKRITIKRIVLIKVILVFCVDILLSTYWLSDLYGQAFLALLPMRALKSFIMLPIDVAMLYFVLTRLPALLKINRKESL